MRSFAILIVALGNREFGSKAPCKTLTTLRAPRRRKSAEIVIGPRDELPRSLADALIAFCLAGGVRILRPGLELKAHTMLVHVSQRIQDQERIASAIRAQVELWRAAEHPAGARALIGMVGAAPSLAALAARLTRVR